MKLKFNFYSNDVIFRTNYFIKKINKKQIVFYITNKLKKYVM